MEMWIMLGLLLAFAGVLYLWQRERRDARQRRASRRGSRTRSASGSTTR
ncbi:hypothetical protein [Piscinibacter koreensis]|uniref:Uncharacterized protein n=1 Tax=Piscinibacter koreensis TaxID=2742824 RepID=A0A7Y6NM84_9BURK|nr:hypothetical protein [Schlegelella koreensis]NUZ05742.1 hypothetical protein [Schlegelella koreensis]